ncbi:ankyrin repeat-containing domain protein [Trichoderma evansii]
MKKLFKRDEHKEKATKSNGRLAFWNRKKDESGSSDDKQDRCCEGSPESTTLIDSALPQPANFSGIPPQTQESSTVPPNPDDEYQNIPISELWNLAYEKLRKEDKTRIEEYEKKLQESITITLGSAPDTKEDRREWMNLVLKHKMEKVQKEAWTFMFLDSEVRPAEMVEPALKAIKLVNDYCYCYYAQDKASRVISDFAKKYDWDGSVEEIRQQEAQMAAVERLCRDQQYDEECAAAENRYQGTILNLKAIGVDVAELRRADSDRDQQELLGWLCNIDPSNLYNAARDKHKGGTSEWLIKENENFKSWIHNPCSLLWLHGKTGSGKSVLSSSVIQHLKQELDNDDSTPIIYYYFAFSDVQKQDRNGMLASLIKQICCQRPNVPDSVKNLGEYKKAGMRPSTDELEKCLITATCGFSAVYIIIDALDECPELNEQREQLMETLHHILAAEFDNLHLFCTSRKEPDIDASLRRYLSEPGRVEICLSTYIWEIRRDISQYVDYTLADVNYSSWPDDIKTEAKEILIEKSDGILNHCGIQQDLASIFSFSDIDARLFIAYSCIAYCIYLSTLSDQYDKIASPLEGYATLNWSEHLEMISCEYWYAGVKEKIGRFLAIRSQSLVNVIFDHFVRKDRDNYGKVGYSCMMNSLLRPYCFTAYHGLVRVTEYLLSQAYNGGKYLIQGDLNTALWYAVYNRRKEVAALLLDRGADANTSTTVIDVRCDSIFGDVLQMAVFNSDAEMVNLLLDRGADIDAQRGGSALRTAAKWDRFDILKLLVGRGASINVPSNENGCVLSAAVHYDDSCFQYLLDNGADVNMSSTGERKFTALCATALYGYWSLFDLLLERGADVNIGGEDGYPLFYVIAAGDLPRIKQLLSLGADINAKSGYHDTALGALCWSYSNDQKLYIQIAQLLIDNGADVNVPPSVLRRCARNGYTPLAKLPLQNGADVNLQVGESGSALQAACVCGTLEMMQLLLDHGADVNAQSGEYGTALHAVCISSGFPDITERVQALQLVLQHGADDFESHAFKPIAASLVPILLDNDADVNAQGGEFGTALQAACLENPDIVQLLLDHGADRPIRNSTSVCMWYWGQSDSIQLLLDRGANVNADGGQYGTALQISCHRHTYWKEDKIEVIRMLLEYGADPLLRRGKYGSPLHHAAINVKSDALLQLLLEHGADIDQVVHDFGTALHFLLCPERFKKYNAQSYGLETWWIDRIRFMLDHGADVGVRGGEFDFPLQAACAIQCGYWGDDNEVVNRNFEDFECETDGQYAKMKLATEAVKMLLDERHDIDINANGGIFGTALQAAAYSGQTKIIQLLLSRKDRVRCSKHCGKYGSALNAAVIRGYWDIVELLLEVGEKPDCVLLQEPDEEFLTQIREEHGWVAEERYKKFWEVEKRNL